MSCGFEITASKYVSGEETEAGVGMALGTPSRGSVGSGPIRRKVKAAKVGPTRIHSLMRCLWEV
jgi:hypothetical protein